MGARKLMPGGVLEIQVAQRPQAQGRHRTGSAHRRRPSSAIAVLRPCRKRSAPASSFTGVLPAGGETSSPRTTTRPELRGDSACSQRSLQIGVSSSIDEDDRSGRREAENNAAQDRQCRRLGLPDRHGNRRRRRRRLRLLAPTANPAAKARPRPPLQRSARTRRGGARSTASRSNWQALGLRFQLEEMSEDGMNWQRRHVHLAD